MQPLNLAQHTWSTAVFSVAAATLVPVLITLCFAARPTVVGCDTAARALRDTCGVVCVVALRDVTVRVFVVGTGVPGVLALVRETRCAVCCDVADGRDVAPNAADAHAKTTNAKYNRFKRNPFYYSLYFIIKKWLVQVPPSPILFTKNFIFIKIGASAGRGLVVSDL